MLKALIFIKGLLCELYQASVSAPHQRAGALHIQRSFIVVFRSLPILLPVLLVSVILAFTDQGRGFLTLLENASLPISLCVLGIVANIYSHNLAPRIPEGSGQSENTARQYWYAQCSGALMVGGIAATLIPCFIELYLGSSLSQSIPRATREELHICTQFLALATCSFFLVYLFVRKKISDEALLAVLGLIALFIVGIVFVHFVLPNYPACVATLVLIPLYLSLPPFVLSTEKMPDHPRTPSDWAKGLCVMLIVSGAFLCSCPLILMQAGSFISGVAALILCISVFVALWWIWLEIYRRYPLWTLCLAPAGLGLLLALFAGGLFTARPVRELAALAQSGMPGGGAPVSRRNTLEAYVQQWLNDRGEEIARSAGSGSHRPYPVFIIAAPGGGIRSAYWTAGVLGALQDADGGFARHVLAISGVSGGAVGAGIFAALVKSACNSSFDHGEPTPKATPHCQASAAKILANDFLAPATYSMLSRDLVTKPFSTLPDRATALEQALEEGWQSTMHTDMLTQPFDAMWDEDSRTKVPGLFFNLTNAGSGERLVLGPASMTPHVELTLPAQRMVEDKVFRLSTAMVLGARFPYVSPEGFITPGAASNDGPARLRLVDGGLSDNSGMETILDILTAAAAVKPQADIKLYVLNIENSPVSTDNLDKIGAFQAPFMLYARMVARLAENSKQELKRQMNEIQKETVLADVRPKGCESVFLLGWSLPQVVRSDMDGQISHALKAGNGSLAFILAELATSGARPATGSASVVSPDAGCLPAKKQS